MVDTRMQPKAGSIFLEQPECEDTLYTGIAVDRVLLEKKTPFQHLQVIEAGRLGRVLILDRIIQTCEFDETGYHEMIVHVPLLAHPNPRRILVIGGGDGGTLREVEKHREVERIDICEIDGEVIEAAKAYLPTLAQGFDDPRVTVHLADGARFMNEHEREFDVVIVDSSDPIGPAEILFKRPFYESMRNALRPGGVVVTQSESFFLHESLLKKMFAFQNELFSRCLYYVTMVPTYPGGCIGFSFCSLGPDPLTPPQPERVAALGDLVYYTPATARAAFAVPRRCLDLMPDNMAGLQADW